MGSQDCSGGWFEGSGFIGLVCGEAVRPLDYDCHSLSEKETGRTGLTEGRLLNDFQPVDESEVVFVSRSPV